MLGLRLSVHALIGDCKIGDLGSGCNLSSSINCYEVSDKFHAGHLFSSVYNLNDSIGSVLFEPLCNRIHFPKKPTRYL